MKHNKYWFKPKAFGYGATPTTWEGWLVVLGFVIYLLAISMFLTEEDSVFQYLLYLSIGIVAIWMISYFNIFYSFKISHIFFIAFANSFSV